jgi:hypothetical protein
MNPYSSPNNPKKHQSWLDKQIEDLIGDGDVSHLPNAGQKFDWSGENPHTPEDMRMAYKIMKDADAQPEWISLGSELEAMREKILKLAVRFHADYVARRDDAERRLSAIYIKEAELRWGAAQERLTEMIKEYNSKLLTYNIIKPPQIEQRVPMTLEMVQKHTSP